VNVEKTNLWKSFRDEMLEACDEIRGVWEEESPKE